MALTPEQVKTIKATVPVLKEHGNTITSHFYAMLLEENPDLNNIFNQANQTNGHQPRSLAMSLYAYASHIDDLGALSPAVEKICHKHASLYIQPEHYDVVGTYLLRAMGDILGAALTPDILEAWGQAYWQLANIMINREKDLLKSADGWTTWRDFKINKKVLESKEITSFYLSPVDDSKPLPAFLPGQYISVMTTVPALKYLQSRQYSLSDAPNPSSYRISVKKDPGLTQGDVHHPAYISNILHEEKKEGDILQISHPFGDFFCDVEANTGAVILISAGVGITPMLSILNTLLTSSSPQTRTREIRFLHATRSSDVQAFGPHIKNVVAQNPNIKAKIFNKKPAADAVKGQDFDFVSRMDLDVLDRESDLVVGDQEAVYFVCGPEAFMRDVAGKLEGFGVGRERIRLEVFGTGMLLG